ncbi:MAG: penicillin-insensitive murein endopeptidase [Myxococcota bacterium]|jgi:penicillin-insensitive murein endopeptidase
MPLTGHHPRLLVLLLLGLLCTVSPDTSARPTPTGVPHDGALLDGFALPLEGHGYHVLHTVRDRGTHYATAELAALIGRVARVLMVAMPGPPLVIGDCSGHAGGLIPRHRSHQNGRDVDILFPVVDAAGTSAAPTAFRRFGSDGRCRAKGCALRFDEARAWWIVRTLMISQEPAVQQVFVSNGLRKRLLQFGRSHGEHSVILYRAERLLRQPKGAAPHDDHFHVRVFCPPKSRAPHCKNVGRNLSWVHDGRAAAIR